MRVRTFLCLPVLLLAALVSSPAGARPCCSDCPSWPDLDPSDPCAWVCDFSCFAVSAPSDLTTGSFDWTALSTAPPAETTCRFAEPETLRGFENVSCFPS